MGSSHSLISANRVQGAAVFGQDSEKLGHVEEVMLDKVSGKVAYALMSYGGVMGMGEKYYPLPWSALTYDTEKNGYVVPVTKNQLAECRSFAGKDASHDDTEWREQVHTTYNAQPYWLTPPGGLM